MKMKMTIRLASVLTLGFAACLVANGDALPEGYAALDYIQGTGKSWIMTDVTPVCSDTVEMVMKFTDTSANQALFCSRGYSSSAKESAASFTCILVLGYLRMDRYATQFSTFKPDTTEKRDLVFNFKEYSATMGGTTKTNESVGDDYTPGSKLTLFASHTSGAGLKADSTMGNFGTYKLYSFVLRGADGAAKLNLVPAKDSGDVIGLYDTVGGTFYSSMTATPFVTGAGDEADWMDEGTDKRVLSVQKDATYTLTTQDAKTIASSGRRLVVRGRGTAKSYGALAGFGEKAIVEGGASIEMTSPITVTGALEVVSGTLRIPTVSPLVGNVGLMGSVSYPETMIWWFNKPSAAEIARDYTNYYPHGTDPLTVQTPVRTAYRLHGYIWNRSATNETWSFWANFNDRSFVWLDDTVVFSNVASYNDAEKRCKTVSGISPGPHEITLNFTANEGSKGSQWLTNGCYTAIAIDRLGRGVYDKDSVRYYYEPLIDSGDGSLLTVDDSTTIQDKYWVPKFAAVSLGADGLIDCNGHDLTVGALTGFGTVTNATRLTVAEKLVLKVSDAASVPLEVNGTLNFASGAVVDFDDYTVEPTAEQRKLLDAGVEIVRATKLEGKPAIRPELKVAGYRVRKSGNSLLLTTRKGMLIVVH